MIEEYLQKGFTVLQLENLLSDEEKVEFHAVADKTCSINVDDRWHYIFAIKGKHNDPEWPILLPYVDVNLKKKQAEQQGLIVTQQWFELKQGEDVEYVRYFHQLIKKIIKPIYPEINENFNNLEFQSALTIYKKGDFIDFHRDGENEGRLCAILIYLSPLESYQASFGGQLQISSDDEGELGKIPITEVLPIRGNVALLDFTGHNPWHAVNRLSEDWKRVCFISFLWNKDKKKK